MFNALASDYPFRYTYDDTQYAFRLDALPRHHVAYRFVDYPGEYPRCAELSDVPWRGLLLLPPSEVTLVQRLESSGRHHRVASAIAEYRQCLEEVQRGEYASRRWRMYVTNDASWVTELMECVSTGTLFTSRKWRFLG